MVATRTKNAQVRNHPLPRADDRQRLLGGKESILIKPLHRFELMALAKETLQIFLRDVGMASGDVDDRLAFGRWLCVLLNGLANETFDHGAIQSDAHRN